MDLQDFENSTTGRLVETTIHLTHYRAFVPNPLPPEIPPSWTLTKLVSEADRALSELAGVGRMIPEPSILIEPFMRREAVLSSRIEGTHTGFEELYGYESGHQLPGFSQSNFARLENQEVLNYVKALKSGMEWIKEKPVDLALLKELNQLLLYGVRGNESVPGEFREIQNFIGRTNNPEDATFIPPSVEELPGTLRKFETYLRSGNQYPSVVRIGLIHYQFEAIHPFIDGNGRVGRLLTILLMAAWNILPSPLLYLSAYFEQRREEYYQELLNVSKKGSWENWLNFFLNAIIYQAKDAVKRSTSLIDLREKWRKILNENNVSSHYYTIVDNLFKKPFLSVSDIQTLLGVTNKAARTMVMRLELLGILKIIEEKKYGKIFEAAEIIKILQMSYK